MAKGVQPTHLTWTLRLKHNKETTLLHVDQLQSFDAIKTQLLEALRQTHPNGKLDGIHNIPKDPADVILAKPVDNQDLTKGWTRLNPEGAQQSEGSHQKRVFSGSSKLADDCPKAAGLKEGAVLAYRFAGENEDEGLGEEEETWNVVLPTYEDAAAENEGDASEA